MLLFVRLVESKVNLLTNHEETKHK